MKTRTENLASEWGLDFVEITEGMNGSPKNLHKALMGFDTFEDAECFAREVCGDVVLLTKRDGHQFWSNRGSAFNGIERCKFINESHEEFFSNIESFESWAIEEIEAKIGEGENIYDIKNASTIFCEIGDAIYEMREWEICIVNKGDYDFEIVNSECTRIHDDDVTTYAIAVVDHETDEDEANEEEED